MRFLLIFFIFIPILVLAAGVNDLIDSVYDVVGNFLIPIGFGLCIFYFFWGIFKYLRNTNSNEKEESRKILVWGVIGMFVVFSIWGIIELIKGELGIQYIPEVNPNSNYTEDVDSHFIP